MKRWASWAGLPVVLLAGSAGAEAPARCAAASAPAARLEALALPVALKQKLTDYRKGWRSVCAGAPGHPSLEELLGQAVEFQNTVEGEAAAAVGGVAPALLPGLQPGVDDILVVEYADFREAARLVGSEDDRRFWTHYAALVGPGWLPPWIEATWDYGGCWRFGDYDWIAALKAIGELGARPLGATYAKLSKRAADDLWEGLEDVTVPVCTCGAKAAVASDLEAMARFAAQTPAMKDHAPHLRAKVRAIRTGAVKISSQKEAHCSGG